MATAKIFLRAIMSESIYDSNLGQTDRLLLIQSFTEKPGVIGSMYRVKDLYGKTADIHLIHEQNKKRADDLLD